MCIRDSHKHAEKTARVSQSTDADVIYTCPMHPEIRQNGPCLLYTSDAADERSSVDLGGRRIIKKKKKRVETHNRHLQTHREYKQQITYRQYNHQQNN